ncbi:MAG: LysM peptidoglycan-binding domain-containing protein, partial [Victivallales bacterium]|nr:LysM peptidoglycan-binding domain-containing protein [Victivallales bacterium]
MKNNNCVMLGVAALCVGMFGIAGCRNQVMGSREFVPVESSPNSIPDYSPAVQTPARRPTAVAPMPTQVVTYTPMETLVSTPIDKVPTDKSTTVATATDKGATYVIKPGDTVGKIAIQHGVSSTAIMKANELDEAKAKRLRIGQKLVIPGKTGAIKSVQSDKKPATAPVTVTGKLNADGTYSVVAGDFPGKIARKFGIKEADLMKANNLTAASAKRIKIGQKLVIPGKSPAGLVAATSATQPQTVDA